jgi:hypothetical protein
MALLAAATLGEGADTMRAEVRARGLSDDASYRLVVQSFDRHADGAKPVASLQRSVTAADLRRGVRVDLVALRDTPSPRREAAEPVVVAWVETGDPDLEWDGRTARPGRGSLVGVAKRASREATTQISLTKRPLV